jgi:hypothetical protein
MTATSDVSAAIADLKEAYKIGVAIIRKYGPKNELGSQAIAELAQQHGVGVGRIRKCRQLALGYSQTNLDALYKLSKAGGYPLGLTLLIRALKVENEVKRINELKQAIKEGRGLVEVQTKLFGQYPRRERVGRKPKLPKQPAELLAELEGWCVRWQRMHKELSEKNPSRPHVHLSELSQTVQDRLDEVIGAIGGLKQAVARCLKTARAATAKEA